MHAGRFVFAVAGLLGLAASAALAEDEVLVDHWFAQFQDGRKTGWSHHRLVRTIDEGAVRYVTDRESSLIRGPQGTELENPMRFSLHVVEDEAGKVLAYSSSADIGIAAGPQTSEGTLRDGVIDGKRDGKPVSSPYPEGAIGPAAFDRAVNAAIAPGARGAAVQLDLHDPASSAEVSWKIPEKTQLVNVLGRYAWLYPVERMDSTGIPDVDLLDGAGRSWGGATNFGTIQWLRTEELVAKSDREPASFITDRTLAPDRAIPPATRTVLRLSRTGGAVGEVPESRSQRVVARGDDGTVDVEILDAEPKGDLVVWIRPYPGDEETRSLMAETPLVELSNPRLARLANDAVGSLTDGLGCARVLELRVKQFLEPAPVDVGFASACETISSRRGDFTEAAVLAAGMARALGLPSRLVAGLVYWDASKWPGGKQPKGAFAFHVWAEVFVGEDLWHPVDPMRMDGTVPKEKATELVGHGGYGTTHLAILRHDLDTRQPFTDIALPVLEFMDGLAIEVVEPAE